MLAAASVALSDAKAPQPGSLSTWTARSLSSPCTTPPSETTTASDMTRADSNCEAEHLGVHDRPGLRPNQGSLGRNLHKTRKNLRPLRPPPHTGCSTKPLATSSKRPRNLGSPDHYEIDIRSEPEAAVAVVFDLGMLEWKQYRGSKTKNVVGGHVACPVSKSCRLAAALDVLLAQEDDTSAIETAAQLLATGADSMKNSIHTGTELCDVETTVTAVLQILQSMALMGRQKHWEWAQNLPQGHQWCVGGSVLASYEARNEFGCAESLVLVTCGTNIDPSSVKYTAEVPTTCERHCTIRLGDVMVDGQWWQTLQLKKCNWTCCERSRPFASPPEIPWLTGTDRETEDCHNCAQQQSLDEMEDQTPAAGPHGIALTSSSTSELSPDTQQATTQSLDPHESTSALQPTSPPNKKQKQDSGDSNCKLQI